MNSQSSDLWLFLLKVFGISLGLSLLIKYGGPFLALPAQDSVALAIVLSLPLGMGGFLLWQQRRSTP